MNNKNSEEPSHHPSLCLNRTCVRVEREREKTHPSRSFAVISENLGGNLKV